MGEVYKLPPDASLEEKVGAVDDSFAFVAGEIIRNPDFDSYLARLLRDRNKTVKKYGQEQAEFHAEVADNEPGQGHEKIVHEAADLIFAMLALARSRGHELTLSEILEELSRRNQANKPERSAELA